MTERALYDHIKNKSKNKDKLDITLVELANRISTLKDKTTEKLYIIIKNYYDDNNTTRRKIDVDRLPYKGAYLKNDYISLDLKNIPLELQIMMRELLLILEERRT